MAGSTVASIEQDQRDSTGALIRAVYAKIVPVYAIYRTDERVVIQFSDDAELGSEQRKAVAEISVTRSRIDGMVDDLRASTDVRRHRQADDVGRRIAGALGLLLQGYPDQARLSLDAIEQELSQERASAARYVYLFFASAAVAAAVLLACFVTSGLYARIVGGDLDAASRSLWLAVGAGAVGAFFSIAIAIRSREIKTAPIRRDNIADAVLRIVIAAIAAPLLIALIKSGAAQITIGDATISYDEGQPLLIVVIGFLAGFVERLVPNLLAGTALAAVAGAKPPAPAEPAGANELNPRGVAGPPPPAPATGGASTPADPDDDPHADGCISEAHIDEAELTHDVELPEAVGGVEETPARPAGS